MSQRSGTQKRGRTLRCRMAPVVPRRRTRTCWIFLAVALQITLAARPMMAQSAKREPYVLEIFGGKFTPTTVQVMDPKFELPSSALRTLANEARDTLARDLIYSGLFYVQDQWARALLPSGVGRAWNPVNQRPGDKPHVVESLWTIDDGQTSAELRLLDGLGLQIVGKKYTIESGDARSAMHHFADEMAAFLMGVKGIAQTKVAYSQKRGKISELHSVDYDGYGPRKLTDWNSLSISPVWGRDRKWLTFTSYVDGEPRLYRMDTALNRLVTLSDRPGLNTSPDWSAEKKRYAVTLSKDGDAEIYAMDPDGRRLKRLTHHPAIDTSPSWSPRGDQIAFTSDRSGVPQLYVMDSDGGNVRRLTKHNRYSDSPAWSPDGKWICYVARREGQIELQLIEPNGRRPTVVVREGLNDSPSWAPDSRHIAFSSLRGGHRSVYVVDIYTGLVRRLTVGTSDAITPAWSRN